MVKFIARVFGKAGCSKCDTLKRRLSTLLSTPEYSMFTMRYYDIKTLDGIVEFCKAGCLNPNRIPALLITYVDENGQERYVRNPQQYSKDPSIYDAGVTFQWVGTQTDYGAGSGLITPKMIKAVLDKALSNTKTSVRKPEVLYQVV